MKTTLITRMGSFLLGGGTGVAVALTGLALWTGTTDLEAIKQEFTFFESSAQMEIDNAVSHYSQVVVDANAEIGEYKEALEQANDNISQLITAYETKVDELENANSTYETDLAELQQALADMETRLDQQYTTDMNEVVEAANAQINAANEEVANTKEYIEESAMNSNITTGEYLQNQLDSVEHQLDTTGDKSVTSIEDIVPSEQE